MRIWLVINGPDNVSEDTAYLIGRIAARFDEIVVTHVDVGASEAPTPTHDVEIVFNRMRNRLPAVHLDLARRVAELGVPLVNPAHASIRGDDKRTLVEDFPDLIPPTRVVGDMDAFRDAFDALGGDVVIKEPFGKHGKQVLRVTSPAQEALAAELLNDSLDGEIVVQRFMEGFTEGDRRIIVVRRPDGRHRPVAGLTRYPPPGGWKCNISSGGRAVVADPSPEEARVAVDVAERSGLDIAQLDFGWHAGRPFLIETNQRGGAFIDYDLGHRANCGDAVAEFLAARAQRGHVRASPKS